MDEFEGALDQCNNSALGLDGIKFIMFKFLPERAKRYLLGIINEMVMIPESWLRTKVVPILKPRQDPELLEKMLCTRLDYWAEKYDVLSSSQYGFRKGRGTRECLALLSTDVQTSFERKQQTVAAFIDISGAYDNTLIDILRERYLCSS
jgi:hypothetical protein